MANWSTIRSNKTKEITFLQASTYNISHGYMQIYRFQSLQGNPKHWKNSYKINKKCSQIYYPSHNRLGMTYLELLLHYSKHVPHIIFSYHLKNTSTNHDTNKLSQPANRSTTRATSNTQKSNTSTQPSLLNKNHFKHCNQIQPMQIKRK